MDENAALPPPSPPVAPPPGSLASLPKASTEDLAAALKASAPKATSPAATAASDAAAAPAPPSAFAALRDKHGNPFDPELHLTDSAGTPATSRAGSLIAKAGMGPTAKARARALKAAAKGASPAAERATLHLTPDQHTLTSYVEPLGNLDEEEGAPERDPADVAKQQKMDAETVADIETLVVDLLGLPDISPEERGRLEYTAKRVMEQDNIVLPFGAKTLHAVELTRVVAKRAKTPEGQAALGRTGEFLTGLLAKLEGRLQ